MFTAGQMQLIRSNCAADFEDLLRELSVSADWSGDEYENYAKIDSDLTEKLSALMKNSSVTAGYKSLLKLGGMSYDYSETDSEILDKIVTNREKILGGVKNQIDESKSWQEEFDNTAPGKERVEILQIEAANAQPFDVGKIISEFERVKNSLQRNSGSNSAESLESFIKLANMSRYARNSVVSTMTAFLQEICKFSQATERDNLAEVVKALDSCIAATKKFDNLLEVRGNAVRVENLQDLAQRISNQLAANENYTVCLTFSKSVEFRERKIPPKPSEPKFTVNEAEEVLNILERLNEIVKRI